MSRQLRPVDGADVTMIEEAVVHLKVARAFLRGAGARRSCDRVRKALTSAHGALRHAQRAMGARRAR